VSSFFKSKKKYAVEKKIDGFRILTFKKEDNIKLVTTTKQDASEAFPEIRDEIVELSGKDFIIDGEMVAYKDGKPQGRSGLIKSIQSIKDGKEAETPDIDYKYKVFDIVYFGDSSKANKPWHKRQSILGKLSFSSAKNISKVPTTVVDSKKDLIKAAEMKSDLENSEGAMIKYYDSTYPVNGKTSKWIKYKVLQKIYGKVYDVDSVGGQNDVWNYSFGIEISDKFAEKVPDKYKVEYNGDILLDLGRTFNTSVKASKGDIIEVGVEEVWRHEKGDKMRYSVHKPKVEEKSRKRTTSSVDELDEYVVSRGQKVSTLTNTPQFMTSKDNNHFHTWKPGSKDTVETCDHKHKIKLGEGITEKKNGHTHLLSSISAQGESKETNGEISFELSDNDEEGGTRSSAAKKFWNKQWHKMYPESGKGKCVYQQHFRGLTEEESKKSREELISEKDKSVHGDLRFEKDKDNLFGFTVFLGETKDNSSLTSDDKLIYMAKNKGEEKIKNLQGQFKLRQPPSWLDVGKDEPVVSPPGGVGATGKGYSKFFALDWGKFKIGVWHKHLFEIFFRGKEIKSRMIIMYAPVGGSRKWLIDFPEEQKPIAEQKSLDEQVKELRASDTDHKYLIWNNPNNDKKPEKIDITEYEPKEK
ncbi:MAG: hypothetical protein ACOC1X_00770, partial [Promethearchaeota archaeon]